MSTISISHPPAPTSLFLATNPLIVPTFVSAAALVLYQWQGIEVGLARKRLNVPAPATTGAHGEFDRIFRSHANMSEVLVGFIPSVFAFSLLVSEKWAAILGSSWVVGRLLFHLGYKNSSEGRRSGFLISAITGSVLLFGSLWVSGKRLANRFA